MKHDYTHIIIVLDASGSMSSIQDDIKGSFNEFLKKQREEPGKTVFDLFQFNDEVKRTVKSADLAKFHDDLMAKYDCSGCTALNDAVCIAIDTVGHEFAEMPEDERPEHVLCVIITDGFENASREYTRDKIRRLILSHQEKDHWDFLFLGADMDAIAEARSYGIPADRAVSTIGDADSVQLAYDAVVCASLDERAAPFAAPRSAKWKKTVESDTARRSGR